MASFIAQHYRIPAGPSCQRSPRSADASHIFLIATYRRMSGSALTASTPSAVPAAAKVTAMAYLRTRIIPPALGRSAIAARDVDVPHPVARSALALPTALFHRQSPAALTRMHPRPPDNTRVRMLPARSGDRAAQAQVVS